MAFHLALTLLAIAPFTFAQDISACKDQGCSDCPVYAFATNGFPDCVIYNSADNLGGYEVESGNGYRVWWNSGQPGDNCQVIVRTPASQDVSQCGYYLTGWRNAGCYYTVIQESFMLQFCCGTGDCNAAAPGTRQVATVDEARTMGLQGFTASTSLVFDNMTMLASEKNGKRSFGDMGLEVHWEDARTPLASSQLAKHRSNSPSHVAKRQGDGCTYTESRQFTKAGRQQRASTTNNCNVEGGCSIAIDTSVTTGREVSVNAGFNLFEIISLGTDISFTEEMTRGLTSTFNQEVGTRGYVSFTPTLLCTAGPINSCDGLTDGEVEACTPRLIGDFNDGTYSFVYE